MPNFKTWTIVFTIAAYSAVLVLGGLLVTGTGFAQANSLPPECRADHDGDGAISHSEAVMTVADYLLERGGGWTRPEVVSVVTAHLLAEEFDCAEPPEPLTPNGTAVVAVDFVHNENGRNQAQPTESIHHWGIGETLFMRAEDDSSDFWLATGWEIASDLSEATINIREGVPFQTNWDNFGNLTAEDVAWSMNDANAATNPNSIHGQAGDFAGLWGEWTVVDDATIRFDFTSFDSTWKDDFLNQSGPAFTVYSKNAFDTMGPDWARNHIVATGPFEVESWDANSQLTLVSRYAGGGQHYLPSLTPKTDRVRFIQIPEPATREALLRVGEVDASVLEPAAGGDAARNRFLRTSTDLNRQLGVFFSGNLWEDVHAITGEQLPPKTPFDLDWPWIGSPGLHGGGIPANDMEQARLIRRALAISIDRDQVNEVLLDGLGRPVMVTYFSTAHPNWDPKWNYPFDPEEARRILSDDIVADYEQGTADTSPENLNGNAFEVSVYAGPEFGGGGGITGEITDAVAGYWAHLGLQTFSLKFAYAVFRPTLVDRTNTIPWVASCDKGIESNPWHFPKGLVQTTLTRGGFGCGFESPEILNFYNRMANAPDIAIATQAANEYLDYVYFWNLQPGVVAVPNDVYFNPKKIAEWPMTKSASSPIDSVWDLRLQP